MVRWISNIRPEDKISADKLRTRLKLNGMSECLQDRGLQWLGHVGRGEESAWSSEYRASKSGGSLPGGRARGAWSEEINK